MAADLLFLTGSTGYLGGYLTHLLTRDPANRLALLVRAKDPQHARERLWKSLQLHVDFATFQELLPRVEFFLGDLTSPKLGLSDERYDLLVRRMESVIHCAATLNRKSSKSCFNVNLRGTLAILKLAQAARDHHGLRRFSDVSTVAVVGKREKQTVSEANIVDWSVSDFDPYARTKKFCEHMVHELLPDVPTTVFRPSIVLGDSRFPETTQFDMVRAFVWLARLPVLPFAPDWRLDIVPADYVAKSIAHIHMLEKPRYDSYNLSSGERSVTYQQIVGAMERAGMPYRHRFAERAAGPFGRTVDRLSRTKKRYGIAPAASLLKVFWPYLVFDVVFDNSRVIEELGGEKPRPFDEYCWPLYRFAVDGGFRYPYRPWPGQSQGDAA